MKYVGDLISQSRRDSNNTDTTGISTDLRLKMVIIVTRVMKNLL